MPLGVPLYKRHFDLIKDKAKQLPKSEDFVRIFIFITEVLMLILNLTIDTQGSGINFSYEIWNTMVESGNVVLGHEARREWFDKLYTDENVNSKIEKFNLFPKSE